MNNFTVPIEYVASMSIWKQLLVIGKVYGGCILLIALAVAIAYLIRDIRLRLFE